MSFKNLDIYILRFLKKLEKLENFINIAPEIY